MAVKVIDHRVKGNGNAVDIQRETILSTSVVHPNVVSIISLSGVCRGMMTCMLEILLVGHECTLHFPAAIGMLQFAMFA